MNKETTDRIKLFIPPIAINLYRRFCSDRVRFSGDYASWEEARQLTTGYDSEEILNRVKESLLKVKNGEATFEQDSVLSDTIRYSWPLLAGLLWVASQNSNRLNLLDFGGSLGSSYYQNKRFLEHLSEIHWSIIEQPIFVECGKRHFENNQLKFYNTIETCLFEQHPSTILLSSVLPYLEKPYDFLSEVLRYNFEYILLDRTPFLSAKEDRITVQSVPPAIYPASYPAWFFSLEKFRHFFTARYELMAEFNSFEAFELGSLRSQSKGFIFRKL